MMVADTEKEWVRVTGPVFHKFVFAEPKDDW